MKNEFSPTIGVEESPSVDEDPYERTLAELNQKVAAAEVGKHSATGPEAYRQAIIQFDQATKERNAWIQNKPQTIESLTQSIEQLRTALLSAKNPVQHSKIIKELQEKNSALEKIKNNSAT